MRLVLNILLLVVFSLTACEKQASPPLGPEVGFKRVPFTDLDRENWAGTDARPIVTSIWYPAAEGAEMTEFGIPMDRPVFIGGFAARDAALSNNEQEYPLILMSHGTGGAAFQMMWLARSLAEKGFIVAAVDHHGNTAAEESFDPRAFRMPWERARDMTVVLDKLLADPDWGPRIDQTQIGAVGYSLGGYTVIALAGGRINFDQFEAFCDGPNRDATCEAQNEFPEAGDLFETMLENDPALAVRMAEHRASYRDDRIRAVIALAPALGQAFTSESLAEITIPSLFIVGSADDVAPANTNAETIVQQMDTAKLLVISDAGHYVFLNKCNARGNRFVPICKANPEEVKDKAHEMARTETFNFLTAQVSTH